MPAPYDSESSLLTELLRVGEEPCRHIDDRQVHALISDQPEEYLRFVQQRLQAIASGQLQLEHPTKQIFGDGPTQGDFRVMPCVVRGPGEVCKTVKIVGTNFEQMLVPGQITVGRVLRLHASENFVSDLFDACLLSSARTAACAWLAARRCLPEPRSVALLGAGRVGYYAGLFALGSGIERLLLIDTDAQRAERVGKALTAWALQRDLAVPQLVHHSALPTCLDSEIVILATTAREPFLARSNCTAQVVVSTGADHSAQHELHADWADQRPIYSDTGDSMTVGDLNAWHQAGLIDESNVQPWLQLFSTPAPRPALPALFISTGSALMDNLTVQYLCHRLDTAARPPLLGTGSATQHKSVAAE